MRRRSGAVIVGIALLTATSCGSSTKDRPTLSDSTIATSVGGSQAEGTAAADTATDTAGGTEASSESAAPDSSAAADSTASTDTGGTGASSPASASGSLPVQTGDCSLPTSAPSAAGDVTFVRDGQLLAVDGTGASLGCYLSTAGVDPALLAWAPAGDRVLVGDAVAGAKGTHLSGYLPANHDVKWSGPKGTSLLSSTLAGGLVKRSSASAARTDITFLDKHLSSAYHPAGKAIVSIGTGTNDDGDEVMGVWLADNLGGGGQLLVQDESSAVISEPLFDATGAKLYFLARHLGGTSHVHVYDVAEGNLDIAWEGRHTVSGLVTSPTDDGTWAAAMDSCSGTLMRSVVASFGGVPVEMTDQQEWRGHDAQPVGWLGDRELVVMVHDRGCSGTGTLWRINDERKAVRLATGATIAAVRVQHAVPKDIAIPVGRQVVG